MPAMHLLSHVKSAQESFHALSLTDFPGENVTDFTAKAFQYIRVTRAGYSSPRSWICASRERQ
jgi:hypothetical protein